MSDGIVLTETQSFTPRFDDLSKDQDRLIEHVSELYHAGKLDHANRRPKAYLEPAYSALEDAYFGRGLYAEIERHYSYAFEIAFGPPHDGFHQALERLVAASQGPRAIRIWRNYLALQKAHYWPRIQTRNSGFKPSPHWLESEAVQRQSHEDLIARIPEYKGGLLAMLDIARACFEQAGASPSQLARLAADREEILAEKRRRPGKPDPRKMDEDLFWEIIACPGTDTPAEQTEAITTRLARFNATAIKAFDKLLHDIDARACRTDVWAMAYLLNHGCSDDDFDAFRCWLILQGQAAFKAALTDPDAFGLAHSGTGSPAGNALRDAPLLAYEMRTGTPLKHPGQTPLRLQGPQLAEADFAAALPRLAASLRA
ncbi:DUF4240 domain-containing protein [Leisingera sp. ANG-M1]|uniref:DUF4240 domain-containing protein n=1 Tax=Leisingera sp. ANG-M1 TaxID=1577895 RepID=UPI00068A5D32|nr:DUF4240 domain-containing protein [Leisingera sp. ANG-M1]